MQNLDAMEKTARDNDVQIVRALNTQLAGLDAERDQKIAAIRAEYVERRRTLKAKRTEWLRRVKKLITPEEYEQLVKGEESRPEPVAATEVDHESSA